MGRSSTLPRSALALVLLLCACGGGGGGEQPGSLPAFVADQITSRTNETAEPVDVSPASFTFTEDPHAFDSVLPVDAGPVVGP